MISIFKTSVNSKKKQRLIKPLLDRIVNVSNWNFDLYDQDNILRIVSEQNVSDFIIKELNQHGFDCKELE
jgi:hypothetical protein